MDALSPVFSALADPTRRAIVARLAHGEIHAGALAEPFEISHAAVSKHLGVLERAGLVQRRIDRQWRVYSLRREPLDAAAAWIGDMTAFWQASLERLARYLETPAPTGRRSPRRRR